MSIEVKDIGGKPHVRAKDLTPNPNNELIYDQSAVKEIADSFKERGAKGLTPNLQPITYWSSGMIDIGHTRVLAAIQMLKSGFGQCQVIRRSLMGLHLMMKSNILWMAIL